MKRATITAATALLFSATVLQCEKEMAVFAQGAEEVNLWALEDLAGKWKVVSAQHGDQAKSDDENMSFQFQKNELKVFAGSDSKSVQVFKITVDATQTPHHMDIVVNDGDKEDQEVRLLGIFQIKDDRLTFRCVQVERPKVSTDGQKVEGTEDKDDKNKDDDEEDDEEEMDGKRPTSFSSEMTDDWMEYVLKKIKTPTDR